MRARTRECKTTTKQRSQKKMKREREEEDNTQKKTSRQSLIRTQNEKGKTNRRTQKQKKHKKTIKDFSFERGDFMQRKNSKGNRKRRSFCPPATNFRLGWKAISFILKSPECVEAQFYRINPYLLLIESLLERNRTTVAMDVHSEDRCLDREVHQTRGVKGH